MVNKGLVCSKSTSWVGLWQGDGWGGWCRRPGNRGASGALEEGGENGMAPFFPLFFSTLALVLRLVDNIQSTQLNLNFKQITSLCHNQDILIPEVICCLSQVQI